MQQNYDIKFLSDEDFDNMPILERNGEDVSDSLGIFNPFTGQIRIRNTGVWDFNKYLLDHELEHMLEEHATDVGPNGIRHKKKKKFFKEILAPLFTGFNLDTGNFSPAGILGDTSKKEEPKQPEPQQFAGFGGLGMGLQGSNSTSPTFGSGQSPLSQQQSSEGGLNKGLNQQTLNPLAEEDPYARFGKSATRLYF